jgi:heavy metal translocating P-type ATPase
MTRAPATLVRPGLALLFLLAGAGAHFAGQPPWSRAIWLAGLVLIGVPVVLRTLRRALQGHLASDIIAMLAIAGSLALGQPLAGLIVVLMQTGGEALERYAEGRASRAIQELERSAPRIAHRIRGDAVEDLAAEQIAVGDVLLVRPGELVPCDGVVTSGRPLLDLSRLTGEPLPVSAEPGTHIRSGSHNLESPFELRSTTLAAESGYARIVELVRSAQASKAPLQRLADRYAIWFTPLTVLACSVTFLATHDLIRVLAVLVVATPCPLILATPVAVVGGISRAASRGIIFRHGAALEQLGQVTVVVFDKTGTLTIGRPEVAGIRTVPGRQGNDVMSLAAAVERGSGHLLARTLVSAAERDRLPPLVATGVMEAPGQGVTGTVGPHEVSVGGWRWISALHPDVVAEFERMQPQGPADGLSAFVAIDRHGAGIVDYADQLRPEVGALVVELRRLGVRRILLLSGDRDTNVRKVATEVGIMEARGDLAPEDKTQIVQALVKSGEIVLMLGDGTNDAPALSAATVGIALAYGGGGIAAEAADAVILADDPSRVAEAVQISRRTLRIAHQSIWTGLALSACAMAFAAVGALPPAIGAMVQEAVDVAVILNALRAAVAPRHQAVRFA